MATINIVAYWAEQSYGLQVCPSSEDGQTSQISYETIDAGRQFALSKRNFPFDE